MVLCAKLQCARCALDATQATLMALFPPPAKRDAQFTNAPEILDAALEAAAVPSNTPALATCIDASPTLPRKDAVRFTASPARTLTMDAMQRTIQL